jgi:predicted DNA-binding protein with PD1-like motif
MFRENILPSAFVAVLFFISASAFSGPSGALSKSSCGSMVNTTLPFILVLDSGDDLHKSITQCVKDAKLLGASVSGLGQVSDPTLAYFSRDPTAKPTLVRVDGYFELASLNGNVSNNQDAYYTHLHAVFAHGVNGLSGHLDAAKAGMTVEVTITPLAGPVQRIVDTRTGFGSILH